MKRNVFVSTLLVTAVFLSSCALDVSSKEQLIVADDHAYNVGENFKDYNNLKVVYIDKTKKSTQVNKDDCQITLLDIYNTPIALDKALSKGPYNVEVSYKSLTAKCTINVNVFDLQSISAKLITDEKKPLGTKITNADLEVKATYSNGSSKIITNYTIGSYDATKEGTKNIEISYTEGSITKTTTVAVTFVKATLTSISASYNGPVIHVGDSLDTTKINVTAFYNIEGISKKVTDFSVSGFSSATPGTNVVTISYTESLVTKTTTLSLNIVALELDRIEAKYNGGDKSIGDTLNNSEVTVTAFYLDGFSKTVTNFTLSGFDSSTVGNKTVTVSFTDTGVTRTTTFTVVVKIIELTSISFTTSSVTIKSLDTPYTVEVKYSPSNATDKSLTWESSDSTIAKVNNGVITGVKDGKCTITAYATNKPSVKATISVTVSIAGSWTVMIYMCGNDLESKNSCATADITEILSVSNQPNDINIVIETGGAATWNSKYGIRNDKLQRWHVRNKSLVLDSTLDQGNMGNAQTLSDFVTWGLSTYQSDNYGLIFWNHGGAMRGVCNDENYDNDPLYTDEVYSALNSIYSKRSDKLEFIGYDACLMAVQDIAEMNSKYAKYMVASEESEWGYGWAYNGWIDDLYAKKSTPDICKAIVDSFASSLSPYYPSVSDQTLAYMNLEKASVYKNAWEDMSKYLYQTTLPNVGKSKFVTLVDSVKHYGDKDYIYFGTFDAKDFLNKLKTNSSFGGADTTLQNKITTTISAHTDLVEYSYKQAGAGNSNGVAMFFAINSNCYKQYVYTAADTNFSYWRQINTTYGN